MGFSEGTEDEFLLTCFVCKAPFGMLAAFCGGCGARRDQAMGVERAKSSQQIVQNVIETPSLEETYLETPAIPESEVFTTSLQDTYNDYNKIDLTPYNPEQQTRKVKKQSIKKQVFYSNMRLRVEVLNGWQSRHARLLNVSGTFVFLIATYLFAQAFITGASNPEATVETYLKAAISRDPQYFDINSDKPGAESHQVFPVQFLPKQKVTDWLFSSETNGLKGSGVITISPAVSQDGLVPISMNVSATYQTTLGIFKTPSWMPSDQPATISINYPNIPNALIYINGYAAGTINSPAVREGTYFIYPGQFEIKYYRNGKEVDGGYTADIQTSGSYQIN
jgi:hypothetical protein